ncbi:unnamed protein product [Aphanomyces euteiches]|uniref:Nucleolar 27S pre-rRNA processing Urb2/Npa2 C-terminal domain-containing protein n=1 Tax=Aphanomyces euteiches TaxID=100861 RepID=A0A6G0X2L0_9STRA|nr:hypothetical protein Ae201684_009208 [Aphanomyces euteiches]KAH9070188.1 hypothetical protein Ae201684P_002556 [Aphanomyces euteiches]KAH9133139.1 hypothetical protein AeRB84_020693 [Aphanomyces euteiches]
MAAPIDVSDVVPLLQWTSKSKVKTSSDSTIRIALALLESESNLSSIEAQLHVSSVRILQAILDYAVHTTIKESTPDSFHLLSMAMLRIQSYQLSLQSCSQLLNAVVTVLQAHVGVTQADQAVNERLIHNIASIFVRLFENTTTKTFTPRFGVFKPPTDVYSTFLKDSLTALLALSRVTPCTTIADFILAILHVHHALQTNQSNKKKVFLACKQSLQTLIALRAAMTEQLPFSRSMVDLLDRIAADALFDREHIHGYGGLVMASSQFKPPSPASATKSDNNNGEEPAKKKSKPAAKSSAAASFKLSYQHQLFHEVRDLLKSSNASKIAEFTAMLVRQYVDYIRRATDDAKATGDTKKRKAPGANTAMMPTFTFWLDMTAVAMEVVRVTDGSLESQESLHLLRCLWDVMNASDIYRVAEDNAEQHQYYYLEQVVASIMDRLVLNAEKSCLSAVADETNMLSAMVECSPKILQPHLARLFAYLAIRGSAASKDDDKRLAATCLAKLVESYDAMRLLEEFFGTLFDISTPDATTAICDLFPRLDGASRKAFAALPSGQVESLWLFFHDALYRAVKADNAERLRLVRTIFALYVQEVPVLQYLQPVVHSCAKQTFDLVLWPTIATKSKTSIQRETLSLMGELLELTDKSIDMAFVIDTCFGHPNFFHLVETTCHAEETQSSGLDGILKLCATRVRQLVARFDETNESVEIASFVLTTATYCASHACITPFLSELGVSASSKAASDFVQAMATSAIAQTLVPNIFLDAAFYEIRPFLAVLPVVLTRMLEQRTLALWPLSKKTTLTQLSKSAAAEKFSPTPATTRELEDALAFVSAVPIPFLAGSARDQLFQCMLHIDAAVDGKPLDKAIAAVHRWLEHFLSAMTSPFEPSILAVFEAWASTSFASWSSTSVNAAAPLAKAVVRVLVHFHPKTMDKVQEAVISAATAISASDRLPRSILAMVTICADGWVTSAHAAGERFVATVRPLVLAPSPSAESAAVFAALLHYDLVRAKAHSHELLAALGPMLAVACRTFVNDATSSPGSLRLIHVVCLHKHELHVDLAMFGRLLATLLVAFEAPHVFESFVALVDNASTDEFRLVWHTLTTELKVDNKTRVLAALQAFLSLLRLDKLTPHKRYLHECAKPFLAALVDLCPATTELSQIHVAACEVVVQAFTKADVFGWHASDVQIALLSLRPLLATSLQPSNEWFAGVWQQSYLLLLRLLRQFSSSLPMYLPTFVAGCNALLRALLNVQNRGDDNKKLLHLWASNLTRLYGYMLPQALTLRKHMVYMLAEFFTKTEALPQDVFETLRPGIYALLDVCSKYEKDQLYGSLDSTAKVVLKTMDAHYKETHQFTGKV